MADPAVKAEPIDGSPGEIPGAQPADEEDLYEDAGDLEFYDPNAEGNRFEAVYLARLPKYLWEGWAKLVEGLNDDDEVRLGTLRTWQSKDAKGEEKTNLRMLLQPHSAHQALPMEYDMEVIDKNVQNHFVFSEEDLPGFKAKSKARSEAAAAGIPASLLRAKTETTTERKPYDRRSRFQPYYRKAVPKKTKIFGKIAYDVRVEPVDKREEEKLLERRLFEADHKNTGVQIIGRGSTVKAMQSGTTHASKWGDTFIKTSAPLVKPKKGEHLKAARIPENELIDLFWKCFAEYQYWSMKALRQRLQQPENYIRQVLNDRQIAVLHKSGPFANHYSLTDQYKDKGSAKESIAVEDEDDDEGEEMEDVMPTS